MSHHHLGREDAPITEKSWKIIDEAMVEAAKSVLAGRRLLHIEGPYGFGLKALPLQDPGEETDFAISPVLPVPLLFTTFMLSSRDIAAYEREGIVMNTRTIRDAATKLAGMEDSLIFKGGNGVDGLLSMESGPFVNLSDWAGGGAAAGDILQGVTALDQAGFHGPYTLALTPRRYNQLLRLYPSGTMTELDHLQSIVTDGIFKASVLENGGVLIASGRQYASIVIGQDMSVGFIGPANGQMEFSISESLVPYVRQPNAVCRLLG